MIQVEETVNEGLKREFNIKIPLAMVEKSLTERLQEIGKTAKIQGFRPGKAPLNVLRQRFGDNVRADVLEKAVADSTQKTLNERKLRPALQPKVEMIGYAEGKDVEFKLAVEVLPEIKPVDFTSLRFERPMAEVEDKTVDEAVMRLARSMKEPELVEEVRAAMKGDTLVIDFDGSVDGTPYPGMKAENHKIELGSGFFVGTFEDQLVGLKAGDSKKITVQFPADYHAGHLAGKTADFAVTVKELREWKEIAADDAMAKEAGFPSLAALRERIADDVKANYGRITRAVLKRQLMDQLAEKHDFAIPPGMADSEFDAIWQQVQKDKVAGRLDEEDKKKSDDTLKKEYRAIAERRIRLGLLLAEVAQKHKIEVSSNDLRNAMIAGARRFPGQEKAVIDYYSKTEGAMERLRAPILEEKVVDFILAQARIEDKKVTADELMKMPDEMD